MRRGMMMAGFIVFGMLVSYTDPIVVEGEFLMAGFTLFGMLGGMMFPN